MTRRDTLLKLSGLTGVPVLLGSCSMDAVRRAEANLGWRMKQPGTGVQLSGLPEVVKVMILATYPPTPQQAQVAETRARKVVSTIAKRKKKPAQVAKKDEPSGSGKPAIVSGGPAVGSSGPAVAAAEEAKAAAAVLKAETGTTVIAVDTPSDGRLKGSRTVMLWNTQTQKFVGNNVYDISSPPAKGQVAQWGTTTARYVGSGS